MSNILHATDLSIPAATALKQAHALCAQRGRELVVLHVFDIPTILNSPTEASTFQAIDKDVHRLEHSKLEAFCREQLGEAAMAGDVRYMVKEHRSPVKAILQVADELDSELLVVGAKGQSKIKELLMGSTTKELLKHGKRPVLVVPEKAHCARIETAVHATAMETADVSAIEQSLQFCVAMNATMTIVHVATPEDHTAQARLDALMAKVKERTGRDDLHYELVRSQTIAEGLDDLLRNGNTDLLVMLEHEERSAYNALFYGDMVPNMVFHVSLPTLVLHAK